MNQQKRDVVLDMETGDPDDAMTLCLLATHPAVNLLAVTLFPGGKEQVGLVKHILKRLGKEKVLVGAGVPKKPNANHVSGFHYKWLGKIEPAEPDGPAGEILALKEHSSACLISGGPLTNVYAGEKISRANQSTQYFSEWTCQGGFVGANLVPEYLQLDKFKGKITCPTWNLGGDVEAALAMLEPSYEKAPNIPLRRIVSKNVCHGVFYTQETHASIPNGMHAGLDLIKKGMEVYFKNKPQGKALHDLVAAAAAIDPDIATWVDVEPYRENGEWGCRNTNEENNSKPIMGMIDLYREKFIKSLY